MGFGDCNAKEVVPLSRLDCVDIVPGLPAVLRREVWVKSSEGNEIWPFVVRTPPLLDGRIRVVV